MKKWIKFFGLSFFSDKASKEAAKRGYSNVFLGLLLTFALLWCGFVGGEMLPFAARYNRSHDFQSTVHAVLANPDITKRISVEVVDGNVRMRREENENGEGLLVNTYLNDEDKQIYSVNGYNVVVDSRSADSLAEIEAYCVSNDGKSTEISYEDYLTLSDVARLNFDFKLRYTGNELKLGDDAVGKYLSYIDGLGGENQSKAQKYGQELADGKITKSEYNIAVYKLYFANYYPDIAEYESESDVPLLRNYYYHEYLKNSEGKYLFIFDDYIAASFETAGGLKTSFYGFYSGLDNGVLIAENADEATAEKQADEFVKDAFGAMAPLSMYAYAMNVFSLIPFIALMPMVVALLAYSILKLRAAEIMLSLGAMFKIVGSYLWFSAVISAALTILISFFVSQSALTALPLVLLFIALAVRALVYVINEDKLHKKQTERSDIIQTEV